MKKASKKTKKGTSSTGKGGARVQAGSKPAPAPCRVGKEKAVRPEEPCKPRKPVAHLEGGAAPSLAEMNRVVVPVNRTVYPLSAIYGAAYVFLDRAYVFLEKEDENIINVSLAGKGSLSKNDLMALGGEFANELINQAIRANLDESAKKIREYVVIKSHYPPPVGGKTDLESLLDQTLKEAFNEDPLDIAVPWEEKYKKKSKVEGEENEEEEIGEKES